MDGMHSMSNVELALTSFDKNAKKVSFNKGVEDRTHVCQKPVALYDWIFKNYAKPTDKILDTHLGSGSSRIAAWKHGLDFTGYEIDSDYLRDHEKRFQNFIAQKTLF
jgi:site-specific DNA-methyltransferase (adenine-specific)